MIGKEGEPLSAEDLVYVDFFKNNPEAVIIDSEPYMSVHPFTLDQKIHYGKCRVLLLDTKMRIITKPGSLIKA